MWWNRMRGLHLNVTWHINHVVTWHIKNLVSPLSQRLWTPNLASWWLKMRGPNPKDHVTIWYRGYVTNQKRYVSTFTRPMDPKLSRVITYDMETPPAKSRDTSITWSSEKSKMFCLHIHKVYGPQNLVRCWFRMRGPTWHLNCVVWWKIKNVIFPQPQGHWDVKGKLVFPKNKHKNAN